jgi:hypothetical protein
VPIYWEKKYSITEKEVLAALWGMERNEYYLYGKEFVLITDHKAIETTKKKLTFGSIRVQRWFDRIEKFQFKIFYKEGGSLISADVLSRAFKVSDNQESINSEVLKIHEKFNHRKSIQDKLEEKGFIISYVKIKEILETCEVCNKKRPVEGKTCNFVFIEKPGDLVAMDILDMGKSISNNSNRLFLKKNFW